MNNKTRLLVQYTICLGAFLSNLSAGMFNIALVDIARTFDSSIPHAQWIVTAYLLVISVLLPVMGKLGDMLGRRNIHNIGYFIFMGGALCCALSPSLNALVSSRIIQGIGAAMYQATNMALIISVFPKEQRGKALGLISTFVAAGSMIGPSLGGVLIQWLNWRSNFWLLAGLSLIAWLFAQRFIPKDQPERGSRLDVPGAAMFGLSLTGLIAAVNLGAQWGWGSWQVLLLFLLFGGGAIAFIAWCFSSRWERSPEGRQPFIKLDLFRDSGIRIGILITIITYMAAFSAQLVLPVFLLGELGVEPVAAGLIMMGYPLSLIVFSPLSGSLSDKHGTYPLLSAGMLIMIAALGVLGFITSVYPILLLILLIVMLGGSMGMITPPNNSLVMSRTAAQDMGLISSILALCRNLGMMFGTAAGGVMLALPNGSSGFTGFRMMFMLNTILVLTAFMAMFITFRFAKQKERLSS